MRWGAAPAHAIPSHPHSHQPHPHTRACSLGGGGAGHGLWLDAYMQARPAVLPSPLALLLRRSSLGHDQGSRASRVCRAPILNVNLALVVHSAPDDTR